MGALSVQLYTFSILLLEMVSYEGGLMGLADNFVQVNIE